MTNSERTILINFVKKGILDDVVEREIVFFSEKTKLKSYLSQVEQTPNTILKSC